MNRLLTVALFAFLIGWIGSYAIAAVEIREVEERACRAEALAAVNPGVWIEAHPECVEHGR